MWQERTLYKSLSYVSGWMLRVCVGFDCGTKCNALLECNTLEKPHILKYYPTKKSKAITQRKTCKALDGNFWSYILNIHAYTRFIHHLNEWKIYMYLGINTSWRLKMFKWDHDNSSHKWNIHSINFICNISLDWRLMSGILHAIHIWRWW